MSNTVIYPYGQEGTVPTGTSKKLALLARKPQIRFDKVHKKLYISHPLLYEGTDAEAVLMVYRKANGKLSKIYDEDEGDYIWKWTYKKGWCVFTARGETVQRLVLNSAQEADNWGYSIEYIGQELVVDYGYLEDFILTAKDVDASEIKFKTYGIGIRLNNPEWPLGRTEVLNGKYKGIPESLWSDILPLKIGYTKKSGPNSTYTYHFGMGELP